MQPGAGWYVAIQVIVFILLLVVAVMLAKYLMKKPPKEGAPTALDIAKARLAKGEITKEEFEEMKKHLG